MLRHRLVSILRGASTHPDQAAGARWARDSRSTASPTLTRQVAPALPLRNPNAPPEGVPAHRRGTSRSKGGAAISGREGTARAIQRQRRGGPRCRAARAGRGDHLLPARLPEDREPAGDPRQRRPGGNRGGGNDGAHRLRGDRYLDRFCAGGLRGRRRCWRSAAGRCRRWRWHLFSLARRSGRSMAGSSRAAASPDRRHPRHHGRPARAMIWWTGGDWVRDLPPSFKALTAARCSGCRRRSGWRRSSSRGWRSSWRGRGRAGSVTRWGATRVQPNCPASASAGWCSAPLSSSAPRGAGGAFSTRRGFGGADRRGAGLRTASHHRRRRRRHEHLRRPGDGARKRAGGTCCSR